MKTVELTQRTSSSTKIFRILSSSTDVILFCQKLKSLNPKDNVANIENTKTIGESNSNLNRIMHIDGRKLQYSILTRVELHFPMALSNLK